MARRPSCGREASLGDHPAVAAERQGRGGVVEAGVEAGEPLVPHQHQEIRLGEMARGRRVEAGCAVLDRVGAVDREGLAGRDPDALERLRRERPFTG